MLVFGVAVTHDILYHRSLIPVKAEDYLLSFKDVEQVIWEGSIHIVSMASVEGVIREVATAQQRSKL